MSTHRHWLALALLPFLGVACESNPTDLHDEELTVELTLSATHVHILSPITITAVVRDGHGEVVTDMDTVRVEYRAVGSDTWRTAADLTLSGSQYTGEHTFVSSGEYELRVLGMLSGHTGMEEMTMSSEVGHIEAAPAHAEAGGYRVEFESFPGHIHENDQVEFRFWIMEVDRDPVTDERPPIAGLTAEIHCAEPDGTSESHVAAEPEAGEYTATHTFVTAGDGEAEIHFTGADGTEASATFHLHVAHGH
jgi:hypothetical protein